MLFEVAILLNVLLRISSAKRCPVPALPLQVAVSHHIKSVLVGIQAAMNGLLILFPLVMHGR